MGGDGEFIGSRSGASGTRTRDLSAASRTLSQLSYSPELVLVCQINAGPLGVSWRRHSQMKLPLSGHHIDGQEIDVPEVLAINR
jgi:hypothetical protein